MAETIAEKVLSLGWTLPPPSTPVANFLPTSRVGNLLYIAGQIPAGADRYLGRLGAELNLDLGQSAARSAALALLAHISAATGGNISSVRQVVRLGVFIAAVSDFKQHPEVANGASDLFVAVFGKAGRHVRTAIGVASLPRGVAVEVDAIVELER
jgi:enamine deaminase RidA (YjgF/YER057c/UK114 family)